MIPELVGQGTRAGEIQRVLRFVADEEARYNLKGNEGDKLRLPWMPFQWADFLAMMAECVAETHGREFLDIGCGIGTKMMLAREVFGLTVHGIEYDGRLASRANAFAPATLWIDDALESGINYGCYDILWLYKPFRDQKLEEALEERIRAEMKPGAILAGGAWALEPARDWVPIIDDWEIRRGAWMKPLA